MKHLLFAACISCTLVACNNATTTETKADTTAVKSSDENVTYAYTPAYSGNFEIGDHKQAQLILEIWKDFDNNTLDNHTNAFADSLEIDLSNGTVIKGLRDSVLSSIKNYRNSLTAVASTIDVVVPLKAKDKNESWVCVWGKEVTTSKSKTDSVYVNEDWMFNKDGKIAFMTRYEALPSKK